MLVLLWPCLRNLISLLCVLVVLGSAASVHADPKRLTKEEQEKVDKAIDKGVAYLKRSQREKGDWLVYFKSGYALGQTLLPAYALLESGVPPDDPVMKKTAEFIRSRVLKLDRTYEVSLAILFLDRLGDPKDKPLIRSLGMRLIAAQHVTGGWNYRCPGLSKDQEDVLCKALAELSKRLEAGERVGTKLRRGLELSPAMKGLPALRSLFDPSSLPWHDPAISEANQHAALVTGTTDNSNTQFAMLGLWAAQRHDVPVKPTFWLVAERFARSQSGNGTWPYLFDRQLDTTPGSSMTCVGLLGLAIGCGLDLPIAERAQPGTEDVRVLTGLAALRAAGKNEEMAWFSRFPCHFYRPL